MIFLFLQIDNFIWQIGKLQFKVQRVEHQFLHALD